MTAQNGAVGAQYLMARDIYLGGPSTQTGAEIIRLHQDQAEALRDLIKAQEALHRAQQAVHLLVGFAGSLQSRCELLEAERDQALAGSGGRANEELQARLARTERQLRETERKLDRALQDRVTAERLAMVAQSKAETAWLAVEDAQLRAAEAEAEAAARANGTGQKGGLPDTFGPGAPSEDEVDIALEQMENFQDGLAASLRNLDGLFGPPRTATPYRADGPSQRVVQGEVVNDANTSATVAPVAVWGTAQKAPATIAVPPVDPALTRLSGNGPGAPPRTLRFFSLLARRRRKAAAARVSSAADGRRKNTATARRAPRHRLGRAIAWIGSGWESWYLLASVPVATAGAVVIYPLGTGVRRTALDVHQGWSSYIGQLFTVVAFTVPVVVFFCLLLNAAVHKAFRPASWDFFNSRFHYDEEPWRRITYGIVIAGVLCGIFLPAPSRRTAEFILYTYTAFGLFAFVALALITWSVRRIFYRIFS
ncbi:hypothetical protein ABZ876_30445 [Streptomyces sp. NPDC046931]|uniref:hypothetical protein n=1 Tax=Streptomyces sp. NPDC046931 TaxID=3154806 RepID=UPI0033FBD20E